MKIRQNVCDSERVVMWKIMMYKEIEILNFNMDESEGGW
jgi:hypothetical protein